MAIHEKQSKRELKEKNQNNSIRNIPTVREPLIPEKKSEIELVYRGSRRQESKSQKAIDSQTTPNLEEAPDTNTTEGDVHITHIVVDCSSFPYIDLMGLDALAQVHNEFAVLSIQVYFACCKGLFFAFFYIRLKKQKILKFAI